MNYMMNLKLRKATSHDSEFTYQTKKAAFKEYVNKVWGWDETEQRKMHERRFTEQDVYIIQHSGIDVGFLEKVNESDCVIVNQIYILPEYQSKGIGTACMMSIIEEAGALNLAVQLQVLKVNDRAITFYDRLGFLRSGDTDTHVLMEKRKGK